MDMMAVIGEIGVLEGQLRDAGRMLQDIGDKLSKNPFSAYEDVTNMAGLTDGIIGHMERLRELKIRLTTLKPNMPDRAVGHSNSETDL